MSQPPIPVDVSFFGGTRLVLGRELRARFDGATARIAMIAGFLAIGLLFAIELAWPAKSAARHCVGRLPFLLVLLAPVVAVLAWTREGKTRDSEPWTSLPLEPAQVSLGKLAASLALYGILLAVALPFPLALLALGRTDLGSIATGYLGAVIVGSLFLAVARPRTPA